MSSMFRYDDIEDGDSDGEENTESFGWGGRNATIFLIDASPEMHKSPADSEEESPFKIRT